MSVVASPSTHGSRVPTYGIAATLGGRFSLELGIDVDSGADEIELSGFASALWLCRL